MHRAIARAVYLTLLVATVLAPAVEAQCGNLVFRIWSQQGDSYHDFGQEIVLEQGQKVHLYIHHRSRSRNPYGTSAQIGYPQDFGYRDVPNRQVNSILGVKAQNRQDAPNGRIEVTARGPGQTALAYSIYGVSQQGVYPQLPQQCRTGVVWFRVVGRQGGGSGQNAGPGGPGSGSQAGRPDGNWQTAWGVVKLSSRGQQVWGSYPGGSLQGSFDGRVIRGTWSDGQQSGPFEFHLKPNGSGFDGWWAYAGAQNWEGRWDGTR